MLTAFNLKWLFTLRSQSGDSFSVSEVSFGLATWQPSRDDKNEISGLTTCLMAFLRHWNWGTCQVMCELCRDSQRFHKSAFTPMGFSCQNMVMATRWFCRNKMWMLLIDVHSKWPKVHAMDSTTTEAVVKHLQQIFSTHWIPHQIVSDNGPQFTQRN